ncbi:DUF922 domain-containing Zn-dependent protease [Leptolyngbya ohadii]|uniref:DUF922 domain-containing Zn-dependent protease n=1 Tax=Leptolyngbya ohadii TaxID=1962290 RepID=UPI000B5A2019|nr:DUF922 domain-containing Zn-dependent protease [Leptolyngbya ohadii]
MSRRFVLLFVSTFIVVSLVRVPSIADFLSASWSPLFQPNSAYATISPSQISPSFVPTPATEPLTSPPAISLPVSVRYDFYPIDGRTADELRSQMLEYSPVKDASGNSFDALTHWHIQWNFRFNRTRNSCSARAVNTRLDVTFTMPQWKAAQPISSALQSEWDEYMKALTLHEDGHKKNGVEAAQAVLQALKQLPPYSNCRDLEKAAQQTADRIITAHNQRDIDYDRATGHGRTQGAVFPIMNANAENAPHAAL